MLVDAFKTGDDQVRHRIYDFYLANTRFINNWDLVDCSARQIVGGWLRGRSTAPLTRLARSKSVWERRIAMIATFDGISRGEFDETFRIAALLLHDDHDLIHKAVGWSLREVGKRDGAAERAFLQGRYKTMPRTMLRYAIERFPEGERRRYLDGRI
jgi:3-methyladenine DNA glycosylase AlkD